jgi:ureidoglycolate lyase
LNAPHVSRAIKVQNLSLPTFSAFGSYASMLHAEQPHSGALRIEFYRDARQLGLSPTGAATVSVVLAEPRVLVVNVLECLLTCVRGIIPVDGDVFLQLAPASPGAAVPVDALSVFFVPRGTLCTLKPGVWHYAPYPTGAHPVHALLVQPDPIPADSNIMRELAPWQQVRIEA